MRQPAGRGRRSGADEVGQRLRDVRRERGVTLREVADAAGVSESFVSQVERGVAKPSLATLLRMASALGESVGSLFVGDETNGMVVRSGARRRMGHPGESHDEYIVTPRSAKLLEIIWSVLAPGEGSGDEPYSHDADEECVIVLSGQLDVGVNGEVHRLESGDSLLLDPKMPHSFHNGGTTPTTSLWVMTPPGY